MDTPPTASIITAKKARVDLDAATAHPYDFPFPPYALQLSFMDALYRCLDEGGVGVFESPTGTGKSLSLICGALRWQVDQQEKEERELAAGRVAGQASSDEPSWVDEQAAAAELEKSRAGSEALAEARSKRAQRLAAYLAAASRRAAERIGPPKFVGKPGGGGTSGGSNGPKPKRAPSGDGDGDEFALDEWEALAEEINNAVSRTSSAIPAGLDLSDSDKSDDEEQLDKEGSKRPWRIFYCSRTHSQLAQVVGEVRKTRYANRLSVVTLAGRKQLCTNDDVRGLGGSERINEACLDLQAKGGSAKAKKIKRPPLGGGTDGNNGVAVGSSSSSKEGKGCPYIVNGRASDERKAANKSISDRLLLEPLDVEELAAAGKSEGCCAYYAARSSLPEAQLILLPYASLLHAGTRAALGVSLERSVVIVDEAHNLIDTINEAHSVTLTARQLSEVSAQLAQYAERYHARLKPANRQCINQLLHVVRALRHSLVPPAGSNSNNGSAASAETPAALEKMVRMNAFQCSLNIDHINLFRLMAFCEGSSIAKKLRGFADAQAQAARGDDGAHAERGSLHGVIRVLEALTNVDADARVLIHIEQTPTGATTLPATPSASGSWLKVLHLNPAVHFSRLLSEAHAVILAGGTMQPFADLEQQIFRELPTGRLRTVSFGHIVPPSNLLPLVVPTGPSGVPLQFNFATRAAPQIMDELARVLLKVCSSVPDGIVVFVPSFGYEESLVNHWQASGAWAKLQALKRLYREPRDAADLDRVLKSYSATIEANCGDAASGGDGSSGVVGGPRGALLLSVVGGKMSEGINFADGLGRCVVMVGMPFANPSELTLVERMAHLDRVQGQGAGREYYTNLCMKAVNQSVGRAIRHINDYATILLLDGRFAKAGVRKRLPQWIGDRLAVSGSCDEAIRSVNTFFGARAEGQRQIEARRYTKLVLEGAVS